MAKGKGKPGQSNNPPSPDKVGQQLRTALRAVADQWRSLRELLPVDEIKTPLPEGAQRYRVRGGGSYEELQEQVIRFAGRVWQIKDGLIKWMEANPHFEAEGLEKTGKVVRRKGDGVKEIIEEQAKACPHLMLAADLYNTFKHYEDCNRSGYTPFLNGVSFDGTKVGLWGIYYDGATKRGDLTVREPNPVPIRIEILSATHHVAFGDAVAVIGRAFAFWIPLLRKIELLSPNRNEDRAILKALDAIEAEAKAANPFKVGDDVINFDHLTPAEKTLPRTAPAAFVAHVQATNVRPTP